MPRGSSKIASRGNKFSSLIAATSSSALAGSALALPQLKISAIASSSTAIPSNKPPPNQNQHQDEQQQQQQQQYITSNNNNNNSIKNGGSVHLANNNNNTNSRHSSLFLLSNNTPALGHRDRALAPAPIVMTTVADPFVSSQAVRTTRQRSFYPIRDGTCAPPQTAASVESRMDFAAYRHQQQQQRNSTSRLLLYGQIPHQLQNYHEPRPVEEAKLREALVDLCTTTSKHDFATPRAAMVVGEPGVGKSTLVGQLIHDDEAFFVDTCKVDIAIWVNVFNLLLANRGGEICRELATALQLKIDPHDEYARSRSLFENLHKALLSLQNSGSIILVILDDANPSDEHVATTLRLAMAGSPLRILVISQHVAAVQAVFRSKIVQVNRMDRQQLAVLVRSKFHQSNSHALFPNEQVDFFVQRFTDGMPICANLIAGECTTVRNVNELYASLKTTATTTMQSSSSKSPSESSTNSSNADHISNNNSDEHQQTNTNHHNNINSTTTPYHRLVNGILERENAETRRRLFAFTLFDLGSAVHPQDLAILWNVSVNDASEVCRNFHDRGLVTASLIVTRFCSDDAGDGDDGVIIGYGLHPLVHQAIVDYSIAKRVQSSSGTASTISNGTLATLAQLWLFLVAGPDNRHNNQPKFVVPLAIRFRRKSLVSAILRRIPITAATDPAAALNLQFLDDLIQQDAWLDDDNNYFCGRRIDLSLAFLVQFADKLAAKLPGQLLLEKIVAKTRGNYEQLLSACVDFDACENLLALLLDRGTDPNAASSSPSVILFRAAKRGQRGAIKLLLKRGADPNARSALVGNQTPLHAAAKYGKDEAVRLLCQYGAEIDAKSQWLETPFLLACENGHRSIAGYLLNKGASPTSLNIWNESALILAVKNNHEQVVRLLLERGGDDFKASSCSGMTRTTPLIVAIENGNEQLEQLLIEAMTAPFSSERYAMMCLQAMAKADVDVLSKILTLNGDRIDPSDVHIEAAIKLAVRDGHFAGLKVLIEADKIAPSQLSKLVGLIVQESSIAKKLNAGHKAQLRFLFRRGADPNSLIATSSSCYSGSDNNNSDNSMISVLMLACCHGDEDAARLLLQNGADVNFRDGYGETALMAMVRRHHILANAEAIVELLLENGADPKIVNAKGESVLMIIASKATKTANSSTSTALS